MSIANVTAGTILTAVKINEIIDQINTNITNVASNLVEIKKNREFDSDAGETIDGSPTPKAVCFVESTSNSEFHSFTGENNQDSVNNTTWRRSFFDCPSDVNYISEIVIKMYKYNSSTNGNFVAEIREDSPTGTLVATVSKAASEISTSYSEVSFTVNSPITPGSTIHVVMKGQSMTTGSYVIRMGSGSGAGRYWSNNSGSNWYFDGNYTHYIKMSGYFNAADGVELADSSDSAKLNVVGFVYEDEDALDPTKVQYHGILGGFSGLTEKKAVFLSTSGGISHTPGTYPVPLGYAISATEILIQEPRVAAAWLGNQTITTATHAYTVPSTCNVVIISASASQYNSRHMKADMILIRGVKTTSIMQGAETNGQSNKPTLTATWSGNTITFSGDTSYKSGTIHQFKNL